MPDVGLANCDVIKQDVRNDDAIFGCLCRSIHCTSKYEKVRDINDIVVVSLDKELYGCVEVSLLWCKDLKSKLIANGFIENPCDRCVFDKITRRGGDHEGNPWCICPIRCS